MQSIRARRCITQHGANRYIFHVYLDKTLSQLPLPSPLSIKDTTIVLESSAIGAEKRNFTDTHSNSSTWETTNNDNLVHREFVSTYLGTRPLINIAKSSLTAIKCFASFVLCTLSVSKQAGRQGTFLEYACRLGIDHVRPVQSSLSSDADMLRTVLFSDVHGNLLPEEFNAWSKEQL